MPYELEAVWVTLITADVSVSILKSARNPKFASFAFNCTKIEKILYTSLV